MVTIARRGPFGRGWNCTYFSAQLKEPEYAPLIGVARPWSLGTDGPISGTPVLAVIEKEEDLAKWKGQLKGKIVDVAKGATTSHVRIDLGHGVIVTASITNESVADLGLQKGDDAWAVIKASDVMIGK